MSDTAAADKEQAIARILQIIEAHHLDAEDIRRIAAAVHAEPAARPSIPVRAALGQIVLRVFYYLGGTLVFAGLGIYIGTVWDDLSSFQRVLVTLGPGFVAYLLGIVFARNPDLEKAATPAHILAFILQPIGIGVILNEYFSGDDTALGAMIIFGPLAVQQLLTFLALKRASLLLFTLLFVYGFVGAATVHFDFDAGISAFACGLFLYLMTVDMVRKEAYRELSPFFYLLGSGLMLAGLSYHVGGTIYDSLELSLSLVFLMHAVLSGSKMLYVLSVLYVGSYFFGGLGGIFSGWGLMDRRHHELTAVFSGASLVLAGHWVSRAAIISASPVWMFVGTGFALGGAYALLYDTAASPLFIGLATLAIYAALLLRSRAMLAAAILCLLGFMVDYAQRHFANSVSWPLLLILFGFIVLLAGFVFAKLSGRMREASPQNS